MPSEQPAERARLLVVDDEEAIRDMLAEFLTLEGYIVRTAADGLDALRLLSTAPADIVLTDLKMPRMGGIELLDELRAAHPRTLAIIMTGFGTVETAIHAMKRGAYDYILKPFKLGEVLHVIQRAIDRKRMEAENIRLREALSLYKVSEAITASLSIDQVMDTVVSSCLSELKADLVSAWLDDGEGGLFERERRISAHPAAKGIGAVQAQAVLGRLRSDEPLLVFGEAAAELCGPAEGDRPSSFAAVPLRANGRAVGFLAAATVTHHLEEGQRKVLSIIASRAAAAIENARLYSDLQATFQQTIEGLASAIDKMDRYTAGHSGRVARYAVFIAERLGLPPEEVEVVRQSALMHDIGKIGCVLNLNKPGKLTADEYEVFKRHPGFGRDILEPIKFLRPLVPGVHLHHERFDGRGYPLGLAGNAIPLIARIVSVADTYDAMTSDRSYRRALPHEVAVAEISRCSRSQFDPDLAGLFVDGIDGYRDELVAGGTKIPE